MGPCKGYYGVATYLAPHLKWIYQRLDIPFNETDYSRNIQGDEDDNGYLVGNK